MLSRETCEALLVLPEVREHRPRLYDRYYGTVSLAEHPRPYTCTKAEMKRRGRSIDYGIWCPTLSDLLEMAKDNGVALECVYKEGKPAWNFGWTLAWDPGVEGIYDRETPEAAVAAWLLSRAKEGSSCAGV